MWLQVNQGFRMHELWLEFLDIVLGKDFCSSGYM
jgi:hypothetical protein